MSTVTIFDLEFTAWEGSMARAWLTPGEFKEVVQIGAVKLDADTLTPLAEFDVLVVPRINPRPSPYFEKLTGITGRALKARGVDFVEAYGRFLEFVDGGTIAAFGRDDWVLEENIRLYGIRGLPPLPAFRNLRDWFADYGVDPRGMHSCDIGPSLGVPFEGQTHNALDDSRSIAAGMAVLMARGGAVAA